MPKKPERKKITKKRRASPVMLTPAVKQKISRLARNGMTLRKIASRLGVSLSTAQRYS